VAVGAEVQELGQRLISLQSNAAGQGHRVRLQKTALDEDGRIRPKHA
jgi:hypothetical protein